jgi:hypothetical protein
MPTELETVLSRRTEDLDAPPSSPHRCRTCNETRREEDAVLRDLGRYLQTEAAASIRGTKDGEERDAPGDAGR